MPSLSVLLPVRNARPFLAASLASMWRQSHSDFEVIAVNDGSSDGSGEQLDQAAASEPRLRVIHTPARGLPSALNTAFAAARAPIIARQDADDLSHRHRFAIQIEGLRRDRSIAVIGSRLRMFPGAAVGVGMRRWAAWHNALLTHDAMVGELLIDSPLAHGTAMMRRRWLQRVGGWNERGWAEDLDLWLRLIDAGARFAKRPEVLYAWRQHRNSATRRDPRYRRDRFVALKLAALDDGLLRGAAALTLIGVGESLARARTALVPARRVRSVAAHRPSASVIAALEPPIVLVFGAPPARTRWREALIARGFLERRDFIFVA